MRVTKDYEVAGHRFSVTADSEDLKLLGNYEPFAAVGESLPPRQPVFTLSIGAGGCPAYTEDMRQDDEGQTIVCGRTPDGQPVFEFQLHGIPTGWLVCSADYRAATLLSTGRYKKFAVDNALMVTYALSTAGMKTALFHAAVVSHEGRGYMFLGQSGTGKSTHASLWLQHIPGTELVNDDNPVVRIADDGSPAVYGSPWSGKTPCYRNVHFPLGGIVLLSQAPFNRICRLSGIRAYAALLPSISGKRWDKRIADGLHETENELATTVAVWHLECLPDGEAAQVCRSAVTQP